MYVAWLYETLGFQGVQVAGRAGGVRKYNRVDIKDILGKRSEEEKKEKKKKKTPNERERDTSYSEWCPERCDGSYSRDSRDVLRTRRVLDTPQGYRLFP